MSSNNTRHRQNHIEVFLFADGLTIYSINSNGNAISSQKVPFFKKSKKMIKAVKKQIANIQKNSPDCKIYIRHFTNIPAAEYQI